MRDEIFGPILPLVEGRLDDAPGRPADKAAACAREDVAVRRWERRRAGALAGGMVPTAVPGLPFGGVSLSDPRSSQLADSYIWLLG